MAWGGGSRAWAPSVDVSVTPKLKLVNSKSFQGIPAASNLATCFGSLTPFLGEAFLRETLDVILTASLPKVPCVGPAGGCFSVDSQDCASCRLEP